MSVRMWIKRLADRYSPDMRDWLAALTATLCAGGCSFIYNPNNIDKTNDSGSHPMDVEVVVDVNPAALALTSVYPTMVYEGVGTGDSRPALIVVRGTDIKANATVTVTAPMGATTQITVVDAKIALDHNWIAISLSVAVDVDHDESGAKMAAPLALDVTVDNGAGVLQTIHGSDPGGLKVQFLDQLTTAITAPPPANKRYSMINIQASNPFTASSTTTLVHLRSESAIVFGADVTANATANVPGTGGCSGGATATSGAATNGAGYPCSVGVGTTSSAGGGGGHGSAGTAGTQTGLTPTTSPGGGVSGSDPISDLTKDAGGGGGGGGLLGGGGSGGGGGGTIYLDAAGDLNINTTVAANGAPGTSSGPSGGGGAGGTIILKAGGTLTVPSVTATGGLGGTAGAHGGDGGVGRIRFDAPMGAPTAASPVAYQGAMFKTVNFYSYDQIVNPGTAIQVIGPTGTTGFTGQAYGPNDTADESFDLSFGGGGLSQPKVTLTAGYNKLCVAVPGGNGLQHPESANCAEIAFLPGGAPQ